MFECTSRIRIFDSSFGVIARRADVVAACVRERVRPSRAAAGNRAGRGRASGAGRRPSRRSTAPGPLDRPLECPLYAQPQWTLDGLFWAVSKRIFL